MGLGDFLMKPLDWVSDAETEFGFWSRAVLVSTGFVGAIVAPFILAASFNAQALGSDLAAIDAGPHRAFSSIEQCIDTGHARDTCQASWKKASSYAGGLGTSISYSAENACQQVHGPCERYTYTTTTMVGKVPVTTFHTAYRPNVAGWEVSMKDLLKSVPLYTTRVSNVGVRNDGMRIALN